VGRRAIALFPQPGHGVDVLLRIYARCIEGQDELAKRRIIAALREMDTEEDGKARLA
jgi:hypothetical protein